MNKAQTAEIPASDFKQFQEFIYSAAGIKYPDEKRSLLTNRLRKRLTALEMSTHSQYLQLLKTKTTAGRAEVQEFLDAITTNETYFYRCDRHWEFYREWLIEKRNELSKQRSLSITIWSAAASTGAEAYTMAIIFLEVFGTQASKVRLSIIGTDLNTSVLEEARLGIYTDYALRQTDPKVTKRHFKKRDDDNYELSSIIRKMVTFEPHNLMEQFKRAHFDFVFLRNVMIYFDAPAKERVLANCHGSLKEDGLLMLGESESLLNLDHKFRYLKPSIFRRCETKEEALAVPPSTRHKKPDATPSK